MQHKTTRFAIWILLSLISLWILMGCTPKSLPQLAKDELDEHIARLDDSASGYEIVSVQQAIGAPDGTQNISLVPEGGVAGACPPAGELETWCVVIDKGVTDNDGRTISHFLMTRQGRYWDVENLTDSEAETFLYAGCDNWDTPE